MFSLTHLAVLISMFFLMWTITSMIPQWVQRYREKYQANLLRTTRELDKFFLNVKPLRILLGAGLLGVLAGVLTGSWVLAGVLCVTGLFAPRIILSIWKDVRSKQFDAQLIDALTLMGSTLKSGLDIVSGVERVAGNMRPPISEEFGLVMNAYRLGTPLEMALIDLTQRIKSRTLETVVYAINIQRETGGNIIKTFDQLVITIREENKLQRKMAAVTAQGRTQIGFLALFPWALAVLFFFMAPDFMMPALANPWGQLTLVFLVVWEMIGVIVAKRIVTVDL